MLLKGRTCLPLWGRRCPVGTRPPLAPPTSGGKQELSCRLGDFASLSVTLPLPPPVRGMSGGGWLVGTGGGPYFSKNKVFSGGSGLGCRLGRSWAVPTGHQDPLPPKGALSQGPPAYFVLLGRKDRRDLHGSFVEGARSAVLRSKMGVLQTPKRFLPSKLHFVQLTRGERIFLSSVVTRPCEKWGVVLF